MTTKKTRRGTAPLQLIIVITILLLSVLPRLATKQKPEQRQIQIPQAKVIEADLSLPSGK